MITFEVRGFDGLKRTMNRIERNLKGAKRKMLQEFGAKAKQYAKENVMEARAVASGQLLRSIHFRTTEDYTNVFTDSPIAGYWEFGTRPHWVHRDMISEEGYSISDWMSFRNFRTTPRFIKVSTPAIHFMQDAYLRLKTEAPFIVSKYAREILKR